MYFFLTGCSLNAVRRIPLPTAHIPFLFLTLSREHDESSEEDDVEDTVDNDAMSPDCLNAMQSVSSITSKQAKLSCCSSASSIGTEQNREEESE